MEIKPLVSCVMPTTESRAGFFRAALDCFLKQSYPNKELIIVSDAYKRFTESRESNIRFYVEKSLMNLGAKRNYINGLALGPFIAHWDDDDYSAPDRLEDQMARLAETRKPITGYAPLLYWDMVSNNAKTFEQIGGGYVCGNSLLYRIEVWHLYPFPDLQVASDTPWINAHLNEIAVSRDQTKIISRIHRRNVSPKGNIKIIVPFDRIPKPFWKNQDLVRM